MARGVAGWIGGALAVCLVIGAVYLPPRGMPKWAEGRIYMMREPNQQRLRARELAGKWQEAYAAVVGAQYRDRVGPEIAHRRSGNQAGPVLVLEVDDSLKLWSQPVIQGALDSAWRRLDLGVTKVSVGVLIQRLKTGSALIPSLEGNRLGSTYLLPDSTDRSTCLVVAPLPWFSINRNYLPPDQLTDWGASLLGPCAYYARFGVPSRRVEQWLASRQFDLAAWPAWYRAPRNIEVVRWMLGDVSNQRWWWGNLYSFSPQVLACFAGRPEGCRMGLAAADHNGAGRRPRVVTTFDAWDSDKVQLIGSEVFLSDVLRAVGDERFQEFWTTSLPVDSALTLALGKPVGEYTVSWLRRFSVPPRFGAATNWLNAGLGLAFAALMTGLVLFGQGRREVR